MTTDTAHSHRITFGDDGSAGADTAWGWLTSQAWPDWQVDVISVTTPEPSIEALFSHEPLHEHIPARPRVAPESSRISTVRHLTTAYDPRVILSGVTDSELVVVGARGRGLLKAMHLGSTAEWLMQCPNAPLLIARQASPVTRVLACVDGSTHAQAAVEALAAMPWIAVTSVTVLAVVEGEQDFDQRARQAAGLLHAAGARTAVEVFERDPLEVFTNPRHTIIDQVNRQRPDLVVMGTKGLTGLTRLRVGSVAGAVAHHAQCSVLLARDRSETGIESGE